MGKQMHGRDCWLLVLLAAGCGRAAALHHEPPATPEPVARVSKFNVDDCGTIQGKVTWNGPVPVVAPLAGNVPTNSQGAFEHIRKPNPNRPLIDDATKGVADVVVFLRGVDSERSRPHDLRQVAIEHENMELRIRQGTEVSRVGFVETGKTAVVISRDSHFHSLRAKGASFFALPLAKANWSSPRRFEKKGLVELSSGAGYVWLRAYLFVDDHPYYARTAADGSFRLQDVPAGNYELVCWMPNWRIKKRELDPESSQPARVTFHEPLEWVNAVAIEAGKVARCDFAVNDAALSR